MSYFKFAVILLLVLLVLPTSGEQRYELYTTAQRTVSDLGNFCVRNPDVCNKVTSAVDGVVNKLQAATNAIEDMLRDVGIGAERRPEYDDQYSEYGGKQSAYQARPFPRRTSSVPGDTLTDLDRGPDWRGPDYD